MSDAARLEQDAGTDAAWTITLAGPDQRPATTCLASDALAAVAWPGGSEAAVVAPSATWLDATTGRFRLAVSAAQAAGVAPGDYRLRVTIARGGSTSLAYAATWSLRPGPGSRPPSPVYCGVADMATFAGAWLGELSGESAPAFEAERAEARRWLDRVVLARVARALDDSARAAWGPPAVRPIDPARAESLAAGAWWGPAGVPSRSPAAQLLQWRAALDAGALVVGPADGGLAAEAAALRALHLVCARQVGAGEDAKQFGALGRRFGDAARSAALRWVALVDLDGDGLADYALVA